MTRVVVTVGPNAIYRLYDADGRLLYVGVSMYPASRLREHRLKSPWWPSVARETVEWHPDRESALTAEAVAIKSEHPEFNIMHAK